MSVDAALGSDVPFDPRLNRVRGQPGQIRVAERQRALLAGSAIRASHLVDCERVQDPYSLRCQPQVMGACLDLLEAAGATLVREANGVSDNPLVFAPAEPGGTGAILSGGNFHAEPVAFAADQIALALAEIGSLAERRIALLTDPAHERPAGLPVARARAQLGLHAGADLRRGARQREPASGPPGRDRQPADLGQPGGPRQHGDLRRAAPARDGRQRRPTSSRSSCSPPARASSCGARSRAARSWRPPLPRSAATAPSWPRTGRSPARSRRSARRCCGASSAALSP